MYTWHFIYIIILFKHLYNSVKRVLFHSYFENEEKKKTSKCIKQLTQVLKLRLKPGFSRMFLNVNIFPFL